MTYQLYNLADDPFESTNLAEEKPAKLRELMQGLVTAMNDHHAVYPVSKTNPEQRLKPVVP